MTWQSPVNGMGQPRTLPDGRVWNGLAYVHNSPVAPVAGCDCGSCAGYFPRISNRESLDALNGVLAYVSGRWYETEYGQVEQADRWYHPAMLLIETLYARIARGEVS